VQNHLDAKRGAVLGEKKRGNVTGNILLRIKRVLLNGFTRRALTATAAATLLAAELPSPDPMGMDLCKTISMPKEGRFSARRRVAT